MAINFVTSQPNNLLTMFKKLIDDKKVETWAYDTDGDFVYLPEQWKDFGWFRPVVESGNLKMRFLGNPSKVTTWAAWGVYHGRFVESMMVHCNGLYVEARTPSKPAPDDSATSKAA